MFLGDCLLLFSGESLKLKSDAELVGKNILKAMGNGLKLHSRRKVSNISVHRKHNDLFTPEKIIVKWGS